MEPLLSFPPERQRELFFSLNNPRDVATLLEMKYNRLVYHLYKIPEEKKYKVFYLNKKSGGVREIYAPISAIKLIQKKLNEVLHNIYSPKPSTFGYAKGKSIVGNAAIHKRRRYVFNLDLEDFFSSINFGRVRGLFMGKPFFLPGNVSTVLAQICCHNNHIPQGAPSSPIVSNMICAQLDSQLQNLALKYRCVYSRYVDDITFSTSMKDFPPAIAQIESLTSAKVGDQLKVIIVNNGFKINYNKIRMQPYFRRQQVTGLTVNEFPNTRREFVRQIRAMLYAWKTFGLERAEEEYFSKYDKKQRNPDSDLPSFRQIVRGKIEFLGMVRGKDDTIYKKFLNKYLTLIGIRIGTRNPLS